MSSRFNWLSDRGVVCLAAASLGALAWVAPAHAQLRAPEEIRATLGWRMPSEEHSSVSFDVTTPPTQWLAARTLTTEWAKDAPAFGQYPPEHIFRRLARIEALALNASRPDAAAELRAERKELLRLVEQVNALQPGQGAPDGTLRRVATVLKELEKKLGPWLADSPEDRLRVFQDEMNAILPVPRSVLAMRFGGEAKLAEFIKLSEEQRLLQDAFIKAQADRKTPEPERTLALKRARGALGYFDRYNEDERAWRNATGDPDFAELMAPRDRRSERTLAMPDLVLLVGETMATPVLIDALGLPVEITFNADTKTGRLAARLIRENRVVPERTPWTLLEWPQRGVDAAAAIELVALYDALKAMRPALDASVNPNNYSRGRALASVAYALAAGGRHDEAVALLAGVGADKQGLGYRSKVSSEVLEKVWPVVIQAAGDSPDAPTWSILTTLASKRKRYDALIELAARGAANSPLNSPEAAIWQMRQGWALVAADEPDAGLTLLVPALAQRATATEPKQLAEWAAGKARLLRLAQALPREELAVQLEEQLVADFDDPLSGLWKTADLFDTLAERLLARERPQVVADLLRSYIYDAAKTTKTSQGTTRLIDSGKQQQVLKLVDVLGRQGLHEEALELVETSNAWGTTDLANMLSVAGGAGWRPLSLVIAEALHAENRSAEAVAILEAYLVANGGKDSAYELYTRIKGREAIPFLDRLLVIDRFEERPLIWKARLLLESGDIDGAETAVRKAISIDPSDGEQPKGDRMRAYAVLREVLLKKGDGTQSRFLENVVASIRLSEEADVLVRAGLIDQAIKGYQEALRLFSDAYCIQSRLARQLARENRLEEAAEHYRRAFELMPDSFGLVESHCFGCEQAFEGETAQGIAERVLQELAAKPGTKAQVYYLLGYLRAEQERWDEAAGYLTQAVEKDADYFNAWKKLLAVLPYTSRPRADHDRALLRLTALDPAGRRGYRTVNNVRDLSALWMSLAETGQVIPKTPSQLFPLGERSARRAGQPAQVGTERPPLPAEMLARHEIMQALTNALNAVYDWGRQ
ncbi:MAG: hypothetical protein ABW223_07325 [Rariglobus sp.]